MSDNEPGGACTAPRGFDARRESYLTWCRRTVGAERFRAWVFSDEGDVRRRLEAAVTRSVAGLNFQVLTETFPEGVGVALRTTDHLVTPVTPVLLASKEFGGKGFGPFLSCYVSMLRSVADALERANADVLAAAKHDPAARLPTRLPGLCVGCGRDCRATPEQCPACGGRVQD